MLNTYILKVLTLCYKNHSLEKAHIPDINLKKIISNKDTTSVLKVGKNIKRSQYLKFSFSLTQLGLHFLKVKFPNVTVNTKALLNHVINYSLSRSKRRTNQPHFSLRHPGNLVRLSENQQELLKFWLPLLRVTSLPSQNIALSKTQAITRSGSFIYSSSNVTQNSLSSLSC